MAIVKPASDSVCNSCDGGMAEEALKCKTCSQLTHFRCSELPDYHLARLYVQRSSTYSCRACIASDPKFAECIAKIKNIADSETQFIVASVVDARDPGVLVAQDGGGAVDTGANHDNNNDSEDTGATADREQSSRHSSVDNNSDLPLPTLQSAPSVQNRTQNGGQRRETGICGDYLRKRCSHGKSGRVGGRCSMEHPKFCYKYLKYGNKRYGCNKGINCKFHHPKLCYRYSKRGTCDRENCAYYHSQQTKVHTRDGENNSKRVHVDQRVKSSDPVRGGNVYPEGDRREKQQSFASRVRNGEPQVRNQQETDSDNPHFLSLQTQIQAQALQLQKLMQMISIQNVDRPPIIDSWKKACHCGQRF